jgi:hypothetical protein
MSERRIHRPAALLAPFLAALAVGGCAHTHSGEAFDRTDVIRLNLTPELDTLSQRPDDVENALTLWADENWRMFVADLGRTFYTNRPSRLAPYPIPR